MRGRAAVVAAAALVALPGVAQGAHYRVAVDQRGAEATAGRSLLVITARDGEVVATLSVPTATLRGEAGRRLRVALRRRPFIEFRNPFAPPPEPEPERRLIDVPLFDLIPKEDLR